MTFEDDFKDLQIPLKYIRDATHDFSEKPVGSGGFGKVYKGELYISHERSITVAFKRLHREFGQGDAEFWKEILMLSKLRHENLISLVNFCNEGDERILVYEYASRGSLDRHLHDSSLTWSQRLRICIGVACGLKYLHDPTKTHDRILHRDIKSANILLDEKWNPKVSDFGLSKMAPANQSRTYLISNVAGTHGYCDPLYSQTSLLSKESDVYSFRVVLFEVMCGRLCHEYHNGKLVSILVYAWKNCYDEKRLHDIIFHGLKEKIDQSSLKRFSAIANRCLNFKREDRPTMTEIIEELEVALQQQANFEVAMLQQQISHQDKSNVVRSPTSYAYMDEFQHLKVQLDQIILATNNFHSNRLIARVGFGSVYKGEIKHLMRQAAMAVFKRLDRSLGQGDSEFWKEIMMLSRYKHENLVNLLCYCDEDPERILGYEFAYRGSLDCYLSDPSLTWTQRIKICIGVARALTYLHEPTVSQRIVLHRDIRSSVIFLDENWTAKVSDFGQSEFFLDNPSYIDPIYRVVGTPGYCDPLCMKNGFQTKESDVYSFGVVLFEVMCGRLCHEYGNSGFTVLVPDWKRCYDMKRLDDIIFHDLKEQMEPNALHTFSTIAYQCLEQSREGRPQMAKVLEQLEIALKQQEPLINLKGIVDHVMPSELYTSESDQWLLLLSKGIPVGDGTTWLSINENRKTCEMVSAIKCINGDFLLQDTAENSRFSNVLSGVTNNGFRVEVRTRFLLPHIRYAVNLVFKLSGMDRGTHLPFEFKFDGERGYSNPSIGNRREDGWSMIELCQFTSNKQEHEFKIEFSSLFRIRLSQIQYFLEGIEFWPVEYVI